MIDSVWYRDVFSYSFKGGKFYLQTDDIKSRGILDAFSDLYSTGNIKEYNRRMEVS